MADFLSSFLSSFEAEAIFFGFLDSVSICSALDKAILAYSTKTSVVATLEKIKTSFTDELKRKYD